MNQNWSEMADALLRVWSGMGWQALTGLAIFALGWKLLDAWGKKSKGGST